MGLSFLIRDFNNGASGCGTTDSIRITRIYIVDFDGDTITTTNDWDTCIQVFSIAPDITPPVITCPSDVTIECNDDISPGSIGTATATDDCDTDVTITYITDTCQIMVPPMPALPPLILPLVSGPGSGTEYVIPTDDDDFYILEYNGFEYDDGEDQTCFYYIIKNNNTNPEISHTVFVSL